MKGHRHGRDEAHLARASGTILARFWASSSRAAQTGLLCSVAALPSTQSAYNFMETGQFSTMKSEAGPIHAHAPCRIRGNSFCSCMMLLDTDLH